MMKSLLLLFIVVIAAVHSRAELAMISDRVPNTTLQLPSSLPTAGYTTVDAFSGITFSWPLGLVTAPGDTNRLFVLEQNGRLYVVTNIPQQPTKSVFLDLSSRLNPGGEGGLLGLAFHPGYRTNRLFFVFYTLNTTTAAGSGLHDRLSRFEISPSNPNQALPNSEVPLITQYDQENNHNAGDIHFGPDGYLYVSLGDEGGSVDVYNNSQRIDKDFFSGILRLDVDHRPGSLPPNSHPASSTNYAIPRDNPWVGATNFYSQSVDPQRVRTEFWAIGLRNPWRISFDPQTGLLYCGDVGQGTKEEIDVISRGDNYGWNVWEGKDRFYGTPVPGATFKAPILDYERSGNSRFNGACVVGGVVYRGSKYTDLYGRYLFGDWTSGNIWALHYDGQSVTEWRHLVSSAAGIGDIGADPSNGDILIANHSSGRLLRLVPDSSQQPVLPRLLADTGAFADLETLTPNPGIEPYNINVPFWSDHASKRRWFSVPNTNLFIGFDRLGNWSFPTGSVWIKHFDLELTNGVPQSARRLETRFLVRGGGDVYGLTYRWSNPPTNAVLVSEEGLNEQFVINNGGVLRTQVWHYPSRVECNVCHTRSGGFVLGFNTPQLNCGALYEGAVTNQISALSLAGYLNTNVFNVEGLPVLSHATNSSFSIEHRVRSYFHANCVHCHQPGGSAQGLWDARITTPLANARIVDGFLMDYLGDTNNRVIKPGSLANSVAYKRISTFGTGHMPPLATSELNYEAMTLLSRWITNDLVTVNRPPVTGTDTIQRLPSAGTRVLVSDLLANDSDPDGDSLSFVSVNSTSTNGGTVSQQGDWIYYTPRSGFTNDDAFTYQITDSRSAPVNGTVHVIASDSELSPNLTVTDMGDGSYRIRFDGIPSLTYRVEYTPALNPPQWQSLGSVTANSSGMFEIIDRPPAGFGQRFYRSVYP